MSSKYEQLIDDMERYIDGCKPQFMSPTNIIVNKEEIDEYLRELRMRTPDEIKNIQKILNNKEAILNDAREKADQMISQATAQTNELVSEHEVMQQAHGRAYAVVSEAEQQAQIILDNATMEANQLKTAAMQYMDDVLSHLEELISTASQEAASHYDGLLNSLGQYQDMIQSNRRELHPEEAFIEEIYPDDTEEESEMNLL